MAAATFDFTIDGVPMQGYMDWMRSCFLITVTGHPSISVPAAFTSDDIESFMKLIDPDAMESEPAHDLGVMLRDWSSHLLEPGCDAAAQGRAWCHRAAVRADVDEGAVWQWALVERVSTGLYLTRLGDPCGMDLLEVAARWTA